MAPAQGWHAQIEKCNTIFFASKEKKRRRIQKKINRIFIIISRQFAPLAPCLTWFSNSCLNICLLCRCTQIPDPRDEPQWIVAQRPLSSRTILGSVWMVIPGSGKRCTPVTEGQRFKNPRILHRRIQSMFRDLRMGQRRVHCLQLGFWLRGVQS